MSYKKELTIMHQPIMSNNVTEPDEMGEVNLSDLIVSESEDGTRMEIKGRIILLPRTSQTYLTSLEIVELTLKTGTRDKIITLGAEEILMLETMDKLRKLRRQRITEQENGREDCWSNRHSWHDSSTGFDRCMRLGGSCTGSCPNLGWGDPLCFNLRDINPYDSNSHLTGNIKHVNPEDPEGEFKYKIMTADGVSITLQSNEEFSDDELELAACEVSKMILFPMREDHLTLNRKNRKASLSELPSSAGPIKQLISFNERMKIERALDNRKFQSVVVKELIPGVPPPHPMQLLQQYPRGGSTSVYDHEFSPVIREPWMLECNAGVTETYDYSKLDKLCARVVPIVNYPDLTSLFETREIKGERFDVTYDIGSGVVRDIRSRKPKYRVVKEGRKIHINNKPIVTNLVTKAEEPICKKYIVDPKRRIFVEKRGGLMVPILYSILMIGCLLPTSSSYYLCGDDKHGTLWSLPGIEDCKPSVDTGNNIHAKVFRKEYSYNLTVHRCFKTSRIDKTIYGFFGPKSHLGYTIHQESIPIRECLSARDNKLIDGHRLVRIDESSWSTNVEPNILYTWCCKEIETTTINYHLEEVFVRMHLINGYAVMVGVDSDISHCDYNTGNYSSTTSSYIWKPVDVTCNITIIGESDFTTLSDGHLLSYDLQLSLMRKGHEVYCGVNYTSTEQGLLLIEDTRKKRDVDAGEKNFILKAANEYSKKLYDSNHIWLCTIDRIMGFYLKDMARINPSRFARAYFSKDNIAAKFVGEALLVWECMEVEVLQEIRGHKYAGVCYDMMPVKYEHDRMEKIGFLDLNSGEIMPMSGTHDCNSVSGYLIYDNGWRKYKNDTYYEPMVSVQPIPSNTVHMQINEVSFVNNHLHSIFGPSGSRFRESLVGDFVAIGMKHLISKDITCNEEIDSRVVDMLVDAKTSIQTALFMPFKILFITLILAGVCYLFIRHQWHVCCRKSIRRGYDTIRYRKSNDTVVIEE